MGDSSMLEDLVGAQLDDEIASFQEQIESLKAQRKIQTSTILSSHATKATLQRLRASQKPPSQSSQTQIPNHETDLNPLLTMSTAQQSHNQHNLYRACATITSFRVRDPDPSAVDDGNILGLRIDVSSNGKFTKPYYIMLNKPFPNSELLRIHRHTLPPCIPLASIASRHLSHSKGAMAITEKSSAHGAIKQNLQKFVRALRREIVGYQNRVSIIKQLRKEFQLDEKLSEGQKGKGTEQVIADISAADAEAKQIRIEWVDSRIGRVLVGEKGDVTKCVVFGETGRDWEVERRILGEDGGNSMLGIGERLKEGIY